MMTIGKICQTVELEMRLSTCMDRWKNAGPEERKHMFQMYAECWYFLVACHHGHSPLWSVISIRSGEL